MERAVDSYQRRASPVVAISACRIQLSCDLLARCGGGYSGTAAVDNGWTSENLKGQAGCRALDLRLLEEGKKTFCIKTRRGPCRAGAADVLPSRDTALRLGSLADFEQKHCARPGSVQSMFPGERLKRGPSRQSFYGPWSFEMLRACLICFFRQRSSLYRTSPPTDVHTPLYGILTAARGCSRENYNNDMRVALVGSMTGISDTNLSYLPLVTMQSG